MIRYAQMHEPEDCADIRTWTPGTLSSAVSAYRRNDCDGVAVEITTAGYTTVYVVRPPLQTEWYPNTDITW